MVPVKENVVHFNVKMPVNGTATLEGSLTTYIKLKLHTQFDPFLSREIKTCIHIKLYTFL